MGCSTERCHSKGEGEVSLSPEVAAKIETHPCYSEKAHYRYARMHLAVAPGCNIQCNYCNRKFDCANESRPGVTSERLTPEQAAIKVRAVRSRMPKLSVVGIAGPGDPLANADRVFRTFDLVREVDPGLQLCLSTNGLMLAENMERIKRAGIHHVTITINATDAEIGSQIYSWVYHNRRRYTGREAATILIEKQLEGLRLLQLHGILCKVNSVLIPGINDDHMLEVNRVAHASGAFLHNVMPLISAPEHGTYFGLNGLRGPTPAELQTVQSRMIGGVKLMRHCQQCRADAVGMLGEDRSAEFTLERLSQDRPEDASPSAIPAAGEGPVRLPMRVAVATTGDGIVNEHFGQVECFHIYDVSDTGVEKVGVRNTDFYCLGGAGDPAALKEIIALLRDCRALFVSRIGPCPRDTLEEAGIEPLEQYADRPIQAALVEFYEESCERDEQIRRLAESAVCR